MSDITVNTELAHQEWNKLVAALPEELDKIENIVVNELIPKWEVQVSTPLNDATELEKYRPRYAEEFIDEARAMLSKTGPERAEYLFNVHDQRVYDLYRGMYAVWAVIHPDKPISDMVWGLIDAM